MSKERSSLTDFERIHQGPRILEINLIKLSMHVSNGNKIIISKFYKKYLNKFLINRNRIELNK